MAFTFRFTKKGKAKQAKDELLGWGLLEKACGGTASSAQVRALTLNRDGNNDPSEINTDHANYSLWIDAHKVFTKWARIERQLWQEIEAALLSNDPVQPCMDELVPDEEDLRETIRIAILKEETSEADGTSLKGKKRRTIPQLISHLKNVLEGLDKELRNRGRHRNDHILRIHDYPPTRVLVVSEWYFRPAGSAYTQDEKDDILEQLREISRKYADWLIVPGTIYWTTDDLTDQTIKVFNQAVVFSAGQILRTRTKNNAHDIAPEDEIKHRWGPDNPPLPLAITAASMQVARFNHKNIHWCLDICRDHAVGEGANYYVNAANAGAQVYIITANGTTISDNFLAVRNNGLTIFCDGKGAGVEAVYRVTRPVALNNGPLGILFNNYWNAFQPQKAYDVQMTQYDNANNIRKLSPLYIDFKRRFDALFADISSDQALKTQIDQIVQPALPNINDQTHLRFELEEANRITQLTANGVLPTGTNLTIDEIALMNAYAQDLINHDTAYNNLMSSRGAVNDTKRAYYTQSAATKTTITGTVRVNKFSRLALYNLIDVPV